MSITEKKETYKMHGYKINVTANFIANKIKMEIVEPLQETAYVHMDKYINFDGDMKSFVNSCLNHNHKAYQQ